MRNSEIHHLSKPHFDWPLLIASYLLALYGVFAITIANYDPTLGADRSLQQLIMDANNGRLQLLWVVVSMVAVSLVMTIRYDIMGRLWPVIYFVDITTLKRYKNGHKNTQCSIIFATRHIYVFMYIKYI